MMDFENETDPYNDTDIDVDYHSKFDSVWLGLILGIVAPVISFLMFYYSSFTKVSFDYFIQRTLELGQLINIFTLCLIPNFLIFALFMWRKHYSSAKGLVIASAVIAGLLIVTKFAIALYLK